MNDFHDLFDIRFRKHADYFQGYELMTSCYDFTVKLLDHFSEPL